MNERLVTISDRLRAWADTHEKGAAFVEDDEPDMAQEMLDECALLREAAGELDRLGGVGQNVGGGSEPS